MIITASGRPLRRPPAQLRSLELKWLKLRCGIAKLTRRLHHICPDGSCQGRAITTVNNFFRAIHPHPNRASQRACITRKPSVFVVIRRSRLAGTRCLVTERSHPISRTSINHLLQGIGNTPSSTGNCRTDNEFARITLARVDTLPGGIAYFLNDIRPIPIAIIRKNSIRTRNLPRSRFPSAQVARWIFWYALNKPNIHRRLVHTFKPSKVPHPH